MNLQFRFTLKPPPHLIERVAECNPANPFHTSQYVSASESLGNRACLVALNHGDEMVAGCPAFLAGSFLGRSLVIDSLPAMPSPEVFWRGLLDFCRSLKVWRLQIGTYASPSAEIPHLPGEVGRQTRCEHVLDLDREDLLGGASSQHRRNISRAAKAGLSIVRTREAGARAHHVALMNASLERRAKRGEAVESPRQDARLSALLSSGAAELFQATNGDQILSSILVLRSRQGAYYESAGTLPEGMKTGASPFLVSRVAAILKEEGSRVFNLGGATAENPGLVRFKTGFGTREVALEAASFCPKSLVEAKVQMALRAGLGWIRQ